MAATIRTLVLIGNAAADGGVFALLENPQQAGLRLHRHVADLVEEERAAFRLFETAGVAGRRAREGALLVAEQIGFDQLAWDRRHVDGDERTLAALAVIVQSLGDQFLAGAGFPGDHHRQVGRHEARQRPIDVLHRLRAADERDLLLVRRRLGVGQGAGTRQGPADDRHQFLEVEGLRQILVGAALGCLDGGHEGVLRAHDDDRQVRAQLLDAGQKVEGVLVRHHHVGDDEIALPLRDPSPQGRGIAGGADFVARPRQGLVEHRADRGVVVGEKDLSTGHGVRSHISERTAVIGAVHGKQNAEGGAARSGIAFDDAAMIADDLGHEREAEAASLRFRRHEGIEQIAHEIGRNARARYPER